MIDDVLDRTIAPGYGRFGLALRRRLPGWPADPPRMDGKAVLVTGAASGLGLAAAQGFAALGATVFGAVRSERRAADLPAGVRPVVCDLSSVAALRAVELPAGRRAGLQRGCHAAERTHTDEGIELMFATHVVGTWVLIDRLRPPRTIVVSSGGMYSQALPLGDPQSEQLEYSPPKVYARTKRQQVVLAELWAERLPGVRALDAPGMGRHGRSAGEPARLLEAHEADHPRPPRRAPTRSSGWAERPSRWSPPAASGTTAGSARRTTGSGPEKTRRRHAPNCGIRCERLASL